MKHCILILLCLWSFVANAQYFSDRAIDTSDFRAWKVDSPMEYSREYHFGFSEGECDLRIIVFDTICVAQTICYEWKDNFGFVSAYKTFNDVKIEGNKFYSKETNGEFVIYDTDRETMAGLFVYNPWTYQFNEGGELGTPYSGGPPISLQGDFTNASKEIFSRYYLEGLKKGDLKLMRNEIFARYGYKFKEGGDMDMHFKSKKWYVPIYDDVSPFLTLIEKHNIDTILEVEKGINGR